MFETLWQDLRHGRRMLAKNPGFALVAILSIAVGVGANAAMFSVADGLILRPLPVPRSRELVALGAITPDGDVRNAGVSYRDYVDLRERTRAFDGLFAADGIVASFGGRPGEPATARYGLAVTANFFDVLDVAPAMGRTFRTDEDAAPGRDAVLVLAHETWTDRFAADPDILGRRVRVGSAAFAVIGVMPKRFTGIDIYLQPAFYVPTAILPSLDPEAGLLERRDVRRFRVMGRLKAGVSLEQANQETQLVAQALQQTYPATNARHGWLLRSEMNARLEEYGPAAGLGIVLLALSIAVLVVACANVAGLLASRAPIREREIAMRLAIGGDRARVVRQFLTESLLLAAGGAGLGLVLAYVGIRSFRQLQILSDVGVRLVYELDRRALVAGLVVALFSALLSTLLPAWRATHRLDLAGTLRNATAQPSRRLWGRQGLVTAQVSLTLLLLTVAVSFYHAFEAEYGGGPGFRTERMLLMNLDPTLARYDLRQSEAFYERLKARAAAIPGVSSIGLTSFVPLSQESADAATIVPEGHRLPVGVDALTVMAARIDEGYLRTIGIGILRGRDFEASDTADATRVAIVNRGLAERYWPDGDAVGRRIRLETPSREWVQIVGIAADAKQRLFTPESADFVYLPRAQHPIGRSTLLVSTDIESLSLSAPLRAAVHEIDPNVPVGGVRTMEDYYYASATNLNIVVVRTIAGMGGMGLALAMAGLYGLVASAASRRTHEIGIRMAVGATRGSVLRLVLNEGWRPTLAGVALGVIASTAAGRLIDSTLTFRATSDSASYLLVVFALALVLVVMCAAYVPARRAARMDPLAALRQD